VNGSSVGLTLQIVDLSMNETEYRQLTKEEHELLAWLLEHGPSGAMKFLPQLDSALARSNCDCGCPSIGLSIPLDAPLVETPSGFRIHFSGVSNGYDVGLMLIAGSGVLSELEVYTFGENEGPFELPEIGTLKVSP
jgi:hypothetical protein